MALLTQMTSGLLLPQVASTVIEAIVNKALALNVNNNVLSHLDQKTLTVHLAELNFPLSLTVNTQDHNQPIIVGTMTERSDCTIYTSINTLKKIKAEQQITELIKAGELDVEGDIKIAQQFAAIAQQLEIDWQSELAKHIGDIPTHQLLTLSNKITNKVKVSSKQIEADITEYIVHEKKLLVTNSQINSFNQSVREVKQQADSMAARIDNLMKS
jgi:ubiquinone biosynthesis protein UbiJ